MTLHSCRSEVLDCCALRFWKEKFGGSSRSVCGAVRNADGAGLDSGSKAASTSSSIEGLEDTSEPSCSSARSRPLRRQQVLLPRLTPTSSEAMAATRNDIQQAVAILQIINCGAKVLRWKRLSITKGG